MIGLFYDTETTGLPDFKAPSESEHQPHLVQLAALLVDLDTRSMINSMDVIVRPDGWTIPDDVAEIHGITTERALVEGVPEGSAIGALMDMWEKAQIRIAHNEPFDARIVRIALVRHMDQAMADKWKEGKAECTARLSTPICKLPPTPKMVAAGFNKFKTASLGEAYRHFTGKELEGAHSALADVHGCMEVYFAIKGEAE
jgi:DNA polymerase-3 subunit epsilon